MGGTQPLAPRPILPHQALPSGLAARPDRPGLWTNRHTFVPPALPARANHQGQSLAVLPVRRSARHGYSHSIVDGGFDVMSSTTRFTAGTSFTIRDEIVSSRSYGKRAQSAVIASSLVTARTTTG